MGSLITIEVNHRAYIRPEYHEIMPIIPQSPLGSSRLPGDSPWHCATTVPYSMARLDF